MPAEQHCARPADPGKGLSMLPKDLFQHCFRGDNDTVPYLPLLASYCGTVEQLPAPGLFSNVTRWTRALQNTQKLFGADGILVAFDTVLEAEMLGCTTEWSNESWRVIVPADGLPETAEPHAPTCDLEADRVAAVLEGISRLGVLEAGKLPLWVGVTGPATLAEQVLLGRGSFPGKIDRASGLTDLADELVCRVLTPLTQRYFELGADAILLADPALAMLDESSFKPVLESYEVLENAVRHFQGRSILLATGFPGATVERLLGESPVDALVVDDQVSLGEILVQARAAGKAIGLGIPTRLLLQADAASITEWIADHVPVDDVGGLFLTTDWDVACRTPLENLHAIGRAIRR